MLYHFELLTSTEKLRLKMVHVSFATLQVSEAVFTSLLPAETLAQVSFC